MDPIEAIRKEYLLDEMSRLVSSRSGIIQTTYFCADRENPIKCFKARSLNNKRNLGTGIDIDMVTTMMKSLAEALERYTLIYARANGVFLFKKSIKELKSMGYSCFYPDYDIYEDFVYESNPYLKQITPDLEIDWTASRRFSDNKLVWVPASYIHSHGQNIWTHILKKMTSNGMSCSFF